MIEPKKILLSAGEISGDKYGASLVEALKNEDENLEFYGMGSRHMETAGVNILVDLTKSSTIGFVEPLKHIPKIFKALSILKKWISANKPKVVVLIDFQGFNLMLAKAAKELSIPVVYFISPQEWQWGTEAGGKKVTDVTDLILSIFEQEVPFYKKLGGNPIFIGHPLSDIVKSDIQSTDQVQAFKQVNQLDESKDIVSIFPGSRHQEINYIWPVFAHAATRLMKTFPHIQCVVSTASEYLRIGIEKRLKEEGIPPGLFSFYSGSPYDLMAASSFSLATSGTVTLEHLLMEKPCLAAYRFHPFSFWLGKKIMGKAFKERVKYIALPNQLAKKEIMPEFLQDGCNPDAIYEQASAWLGDSNTLAKVEHAFADVKPTVFRTGVVKAAAHHIMGVLNPQPELKSQTD